MDNIKEMLEAPKEKVIEMYEKIKAERDELADFFCTLGPVCLPFVDKDGERKQFQCLVNKETYEMLKAANEK